MDEMEYSTFNKMAPRGSLFETFADRVVRRAEDVLAGRGLRLPLLDQDRLVLTRLMRHRGKSAALGLGALCTHLGLTERQVKDSVSSLRHDHRVQIGASRDSDAGGYYLIQTQVESEESTRPMLHQALSMIRVVVVQRGERDTTLEALTQLRLDLESEEV